MSTIDSSYFECNLSLNPDLFMNEVYLLKFFERNFGFTSSVSNCLEAYFVKVNDQLRINSYWYLTVGFRRRK